MKRQKGYTLFETIIVIAIMAILASLSLASIGIINKAKYNSAISSFKNNMSSLWVITKATSQAKVQSTASTSTVEQMYPVCMRLQQNANGTYWLVLGYRSPEGFIPKNDDINDAKQNGDIVELPSILTIEFEKENDDQVNVNMNNATSIADFPGIPVSLIEFNKSDGSVRYGAGDYTFKYYDKVVGHMNLDSSTGKQNVK